MVSIERKRELGRAYYERKLAKQGRTKRTLLTPEQKRQRRNANTLSWIARNPERHLANQRAWRAKNKERTNTERLEKLHTNVLFRLGSNLRTRLRVAMKRGTKTGSAVRDLGCSIPDLKTHIERQFAPGMSWDNWGKWHLDHIKPLASFNLLDREQLLRACHYTNLQPLWAKDNLRKGSRV